MTSIMLTYIVSMIKVKHSQCPNFDEYYRTLKNGDKEILTGFKVTQTFAMSLMFVWIFLPFISIPLIKFVLTNRCVEIDEREPNMQYYQD